MLCAPLVATAAHGDGPLININTADVETLDTLDGIGGTLALRIVDYRTQNGPFATIEDISNVQGIGGPGSASYEKIKDHITVVGATDDISSEVNTDSAASGEGIHESTLYQYNTVTIQPPEDVFIRTREVINTVPYAFTQFSIESYDAKGDVVEDGRVVWSFGDGAEAYGRSVVHQYEYEGAYTAVVTLTDGSLSDEAHITVDVHPLVATLTVADDGSWTEIQNTSEHDLDISSWRLVAGGNYFTFPQKTIVGAGTAARFSSTVTKLTAHQALPEVVLVYPNGKIALNGTRESSVIAQVDTDVVISAQAAFVEEDAQHATIGSVLQPIRIPLASSATTSRVSETIPQHPEEIVEYLPEAKGTTPSTQWGWVLALVVALAAGGIFALRRMSLVVAGYEVVDKTAQS